MTARKKHILFDANSLVQNKSGVGQFSERLLTALADKSANTQITAYYFNFLGRKKVSGLPLRQNIDYKVIRFLPTKLMSVFHHLGLQIPLEFFMSTQDYTYLLFPNFVAVPSLRKIPFSITIHDLAYKDCPEFLTPGNRSFLTRFVGRSVQNAKSIMVVSDFTKKRVTKWYGKIAGDKSLIVPIPYEPLSPKGKVSESIASLKDKPFFLFVGTIEPRKNLIALTEAFSIAQTKLGKDFSLVLAGGDGWKNSDIYAALEESDNQNIVTTGYITDVERDYLYKNCSAVCMVSSYEGFGMPILEAQYYNKPVVASSIDVFREVSGGNAIFVNPSDINNIADGMIKAVSTKPQYKKSRFSWSSNAEAVLRVIEENDD